MKRKAVMAPLNIPKTELPKLRLILSLSDDEFGMLTAAVRDTAQSPELFQEFSTLAKQWRKETGLLSIAKQKAMHPAYQKIIGMGKEVLPLILEELRTRGGDWFWALEMIVRNENPAKGTTSYRDAVNAWLEWGREHGLTN